MVVDNQCWRVFKDAYVPRLLHLRSETISMLPRAERAERSSEVRLDRESKPL